MTFVDDTNVGPNLEMGNAAPTDGLTSIFTLVPPETAFTLKEISTWSPGCIIVTALPPVVVVKIPVESLVPWVRVTGTLLGVEKTISIPVRSTADACDGTPRENVIVSIPLNGSEDIP